MVALQDSSKGLEGTRVVEMADEIEVCVLNVYWVHHMNALMESW